MTQRISIDFLSILILTGAAQGLLLAVSLAVIRKGTRRANLFLSGLLVTLSIGLVDGFLNLANYYTLYPHLIGLVWPVNFLVGPFLYLYVRELTSPKRNDFSWNHLVHSLPALIYVLLLIPFYSISPDEKTRIWTSSVVPVKGLQIFTQEGAPLFVVLQKAAYYASSFFLISAYASKIKESFSSIDKISLSWLRTLLVLFFLLCFVFTFYSFCASPFGMYRESGYFFYLSSAIVAYVLALKALIQPEIFSRLEAVHQAELTRTCDAILPEIAAANAEVSAPAAVCRDREKYQKSALSNEEAAEIRRRLLELMDREKLFLEPELTLPQLSQKLSVSAHHLSQVINDDLKKSFFDFVNEYRVRETQKVLTSPESERLTILGIALDAGFNSKSAFYAAFSKHTGLTPSQFRKQHRTIPFVSERG